MLQVLQELFNRYEEVKIHNHDRYFSFNMLKSRLEKLNTPSRFSVKSIGKSEKGQDVYKISIGSGPTKIMAWSQMHGNEATGTLALLEFLELLTLDGLPNVWEELSFVCVLMVNPDGANNFTRRNGYNIDINRDALAKTSCETKLLIEQIEIENPDIALNLHDQRNIFGVSGYNNPATVSFLAPSYNSNRGINKCREKCMRVISALAENLIEKYGNHIAKYSDEFYPTAFGELVQSMGVPCVLIESGANAGGPNRELAREMNVYTFFKLLSVLIDGGWKNKTVDQYRRIPENNTSFFDVIIKNVKVNLLNRTENIDLGLLIQQKLENETLTDYYQIVDVGDLSFKNGLEEIDASRLTAINEPFELNTMANFKWPNIGISFTDGIRK